MREGGDLLEKIQKVAILTHADDPIRIGARVVVQTLVSIPL